MTRQPVGPDLGTTSTDLPDGTAVSASPLAPGEKPGIVRVLRDQKKALWVGLVLVVASFWILGQLDRWTLAACIAVGVLLGVANQVATEMWLLKMITSGENPSRNQMIAATLIRLGVLTVVAVGIAVVLWPDGVGLLLGLAVYRLIALTMTSMTLLKELKEP